MSPAEYAAKFWNLKVFITAENAQSASASATSMYLPDPRSPGTRPGRPMEPGRWEKYRVDRYRLNDSGYLQYLTQELKKEAMIGVKVMRIDGSYDTLSVKMADISYALIAPFWGKGYPEECAVVLQLWDRYGIKKTSADNLISQGLIGLDCNGFVGGYIERRNSPNVWRRKAATKTSYYIKDLLGPATSYFKSWDDFDPPGNDCLLMGLCDAAGNLKDHTSTGEVGHIVITEPGTLSKDGANGPVSVDVVESTGPVGTVGLQRSQYNILSMTHDSAAKGVFRVQRGSKLGTGYEFAHFRITRLS